MVAATSTHFDKRLYPAVDEADKESCRPDFAIALYPGHLWKRGGNLELNPNVPVTSNTPPTFLAQAENDPVDPVENSLVYFMALKKAGIPVEMHLYAQGEHAFGLRRTELPITRWPELVETWLQTIGMTSVERNSPATPAIHIQPCPGFRMSITDRPASGERFSRLTAGRSRMLTRSGPEQN
jgi:acetyl esterase/lipase